MFAETREPTGLLSEPEWAARLQSELGYEVVVRYSRARRYVLRIHDLCQAPGALRRAPGEGILVRMNRFFAAAPPDVRAAVVAWVRSGRRARRANVLLDDWIQERIGHLERTQPRRVLVEQAGHAHDLGPLVDRLWRAEFATDFAARSELPAVTWGRRGRSQSRHSLQLGIYDYHARVVRIHRVLDQPTVPEFFVDYVLFHELLHAALDDGHHADVDSAEKAREDACGARARMRHHGPAFRRRERNYSDYEAALRWERRHLPALIRSARSGRPLSAQGVLRF